MTMITLNTNYGAISIELNHDKAPATTANFLRYAKAGFYDGTLFHRVIPGFMILGGGFTPSMNQKSTRGMIQNESTNGLKNERGTIAMARTSAPHSATAQFFINLRDNDFLNHGGRDFGYAVFGRVADGMDVVDAIAAVATDNKAGHQDVPVDPVEIIEVTVDE